MTGPHFTLSTDPAFPPHTEPPYTQKHNDGTVQESFQDAWGRYWIYYHRPDGTVDRMTTDSGDPNDLTEWRDAEPGEEPIGRSSIAQQDSRPLEETTPLFGPQEPPAPEPDYDPGDQPREGHWAPRSMQWVYDEPTMKSAGILDDDSTHTLGERKPGTDEESSAADHQAGLDDEVAGPLRSGHWDPAALRFVYDEPETSSVGRVLDDESTHSGLREC